MYVSESGYVSLKQLFIFFQYQDRNSYVQKLLFFFHLIIDCNVSEFIAMDVNFLNLCQSAWREVLNHFQNAVVFIDSKAGECLHWSIGTENILLEGAVAIKELNAYKVDMFVWGTIDAGNLNHAFWGVAGYPGTWDQGLGSVCS